ncbi:MAG: Gfo/Idh/MocA family oxidoreductase, partial [Planctomycetota bacterium]
MHAAYNVALIGAGGIARAHRQAANASDGVVKVTAAVDVREDAPAADLLPVYPTLDALLASEHKPDAIVLCTPPSVRAEVIEPALAAGLGVLTEKPVARSHAEAEALLKIVEEHDAGDRCFVGYCHRFTPAIVEMRRRLLAGDLGTPIRFENTFA